MKNEIEELRKREVDRMKELDELKKKIEEQGQLRNGDVELEYVLDFNKEDYLNRGFIESAKWIREVASKRLIEKMMEEQNLPKFGALLTAKKTSSHLGIRTCARYNRGEPCNQGKWHSTHNHQNALWTRHGPQVNPDEAYNT